MSTRSLLVLATLALACTSIEGREPESPQFAPPPPVGSTSTAIQTPASSDVRAAISSVVVEGDCPEASAKPTAPAAAAPMRPGDVAAGKAVWHPPCQQSLMQLSFENVGKRDAIVQVKGVRMIDVANDRSVAQLDAREPTVWNDASGGYLAWNERLSIGAKLGTSYELSAPDWNDVQRKIGGDGDLWTRSFVLEVDVGIDGDTTTLRSPEFTRPPRHVSPPT